MNIKPRTQKTAKQIALYIILTLFAVFFMFLFFFMFFKSMMSGPESYGNPTVKFFPTEWHSENYIKVFKPEFLRYFGNTMIVVGITVVGVPLAATLCAYGFSRMQFFGKNFWFSVTLATMMLPSTVVQIPLFVMYRTLGMTGNLLPLILPPLFGGGAMNIFLARQFMRTFPKELDESAKIDGANRFTVYYRIILPLCMPIIVFIMVGAFTSAWNDFNSALIYINKRQWYTLALGIYRQFMIEGSANVFPNIKMATGVVMVIPVAIIFLIFQKQIIGGVVTSGLKG